MGQIRAVTDSASGGEGSSTRGNLIAFPSRTRTWRGRMRQRRRTCSLPKTAVGRTGAPVCSASLPTPRFGAARVPRRIRVPSGKMQTVPPRSTARRAVSSASSSASPRRIGKAPRRESSQPCQRRSNSSTLAT